MKNFPVGKHAVIGGGRASVVFSAPLHGGSSEEWVTRPTELQERFQGNPIPTIRRANVPPQGFSEDHTGPPACHFATFNLSVPMWTKIL